MFQGGLLLPKICAGCDEEIVSRKTWCAQCLKSRKILQNILGQRKRREANQKLCKECSEVYTNTKYCNPCSQKVRAAKLKKYRIKPCGECGTNISHRQKNAKYCVKCAEVVEANKQALRMDKNLVKHVVEKEEINPMFLSRGKVRYTGYSDNV